MISLQLENVNKINCLKNALKRVKNYGIDVSNYYQQLNEIIANYEQSKKKELEKNETEINLTLDSNNELTLSINLELFSTKINWCILFLNLIDKTDNWNLDTDIDDTFYLLHNKIDKIIDYIYSIDMQKIIINRYYDLILMKILKDYKEDKYEYLEEYDDIRRNEYLKDSIKRYLESKNVLLSEKISYDCLKIIIEKELIAQPKSEIVRHDEQPQTDIIETCNKISIISNLSVSLKKVYEIVVSKNKNLLLDKFSSLKKVKSRFINIQGKRYLIGKLKLNEEYFKDKDVDFSYFGSVSTMEKMIDRIYDSCKKLCKFRPNDLDSDVIYSITEKEFNYIDFKGLNLSSVDFKGAYLFNVDLSNTKARIDPEEVILHNCCLENCYIINKFFMFPSAKLPDLFGTILVENFNEIAILEIKYKLGIVQKLILDKISFYYDNQSNSFKKKR